MTRSSSRVATPRPVCMLTHSYFEEDARVRREAGALVARGRPVDVFALRRPGDEPEALIDGVRLRRLAVRRHQGAGIATYLGEYLAFFGLALAAATSAHRARRYALVQVHTLPDFLVGAALPLRMVGVPVILDLHEAMPAFFGERFAGSANRLTMGALDLQERISIGLADAVITVNDALGDRLVARGVPRAKVTIVLNSPDLALFETAAHPARTFMADGVLRLVYAGALTPTYELDVVLDAVARLAALRPGLPVDLRIFGRGDSAADLQRTAAALGIADRVHLEGRIPLEAVAGAIAAADLGVAPTRRNPFTDYSLSTKVFEYAAMGKPVVASALATVRRYFPAGTIAGYEPGDADDLARVILELVDDPAAREDRLARTRAHVDELGWDVQAARYAALVERLAVDGRTGAEPAGGPLVGHRQ